MKILMLSSGTAHSPLSHRPISIARELIKRGHLVTMMAPSADKYSKFKLDQPAEIDGIKMVYPYQFRTGIQAIDLLPYIVHSSLLGLFQKADVTYVSKATPTGLASLFTKWFGRTSLVLDSDDLDAEVMQAEGQPAIIWQIVSMCERIIARNADAIVSASRLLFDDYRDRFPGTPGVRVPNGVDPAKFPIAPTRTRPPHIIFFGLMGRTSILSPLIKSLPGVIEKLGIEAVQLDIIGDGPSRGDLESLTKTLGLESSVHFKGWATYDELRQYVAKEDVGICIMPKERTTAACSNQKVSQYMALGLTPIVSEVGDLPLYVDNGSAGLIVPPGDLDALAGAIEQLLTDSKLRHNLAERGTMLASSKYSWRNLSGQVEQLLEQIA
jgi:glycosyltransferase involved in cell wall biosynthesis